MQSEECRPGVGINAVGAQRYAIFRLAKLLGAPNWQNSLSLAFPASDIAALERATITPACIGLLGMAGALPYCYTEAIARAATPAARAFMDLLSAPAIESFCTVWSESRPEIRPLPVIPPQRGQLRARALGEQCTQSLGVPVRVEQFAGRWCRLPGEQCTALGGGNASCGAGALLGERLWRLDGAVRIHIGPLDKPAAQAFLPGARAACTLAALWRSIGGAGVGVQAEARILLRPHAMARVRLGGSQRLGYDALLSTRQPAVQRDDLRYRLC